MGPHQQRRGEYTQHFHQCLNNQRESVAFVWDRREVKCILAHLVTLMGDVW